MKKILLIFIFTTTISTLFAQERLQQVKQMRIAFLTKELDLSISEAEKFWPIFNQMEKERSALRAKGIENMADARIRWQEISDTDADAMLQDYLKHKQAELALETKYIQEFKKVIPSKKVVKLFAAERKFQNMLLKRLRSGQNPDNSQN